MIGPLLNVFELHSQASLTLRTVTDANAKRGSGLIELFFSTPTSSYPSSRAPMMKSYFTTHKERSRGEGG